MTEAFDSRPFFIQSPIARWIASQQPNIAVVDCPVCEGSGEREDHICFACNGTGRHLQQVAS